MIRGGENHQARVKIEISRQRRRLPAMKVRHTPGTDARPVPQRRRHAGQQCVGDVRRPTPARDGVDGFLIFNDHGSDAPCQLPVFQRTAIYSATKRTGTGSAAGGNCPSRQDGFIGVHRGGENHRRQTALPPVDFVRLFSGAPTPTPLLPARPAKLRPAPARSRRRQFPICRPTHQCGHS